MYHTTSPYGCRKPSEFGVSTPWTIIDYTGEKCPEYSIEYFEVVVCRVRVCSRGYYILTELEKRSSKGTRVLRKSLNLSGRVWKAHRTCRVGYERCTGNQTRNRGYFYPSMPTPRVTANILFRGTERIEKGCGRVTELTEL